MGRYSAMHPVHRTKHVIDSEGGTTAGTVSVIDIVTTVDDPSRATTNEVETGSKINGIYLRIEALHASGAGRSNMYFMLFKNIGNRLGTPRPQPNAVGASDLKRYVIHQEMIMLNGDAGNGQPRVLFNGVIKFPRGYIRNGPDDKWQVVLLIPTVLSDWCLQCHYKEFK